MKEEEINAKFDKWWNEVKLMRADTQYASRTAARAAFKAAYEMMKEKKND
jgi:outer membrane murein-binding lipoprotein Lpp